VYSFLSSPLIVLSKRLKLTRNALVRHRLGRPEDGPRRVQIFFAQHFASTIQFDWHNAVELQPITERRAGPLHRRLSVPYIRLRQGYLGLRVDHLRASRVVERGSSPGGYLATSVDQLVTLLLAKYAGEVV
jgi:hypothetical protein